MRKSRFTEEQIAYALRQAESGDLTGERQRGRQLPARAAVQQRFVDHGAQRCGHQQGLFRQGGRQLELSSASLQCGGVWGVFGASHGLGRECRGL